MRLCSKVLALVSALAAGAGAAGAGPQAQGPDFTWVEVQGARVGNPGAAGLASVWGLGLAGGLWLTPNWGLETSLLRYPVEVPAVSWRSLQVDLHGSLLWDPLPNPGLFRPFLRLGAGLSGGVYEPPLAVPGTNPGLGLTLAQLTTPNTPSTTTRLSLLAGAGLQTLLGAHGLATLEARALNIQVTPSQGRTETQVLLGVGFRWGQPEPSPVTAAAHPTVVPLPPPRPAPPEPLPSRPARPATAATEPVQRPPEPEIIVSDLTLPRKIVLDEKVLHFTHGGAELSPEGERAVKEVAARLRRYPGAYWLEVVGHASRTGSRETNLRLSLRRARTVAGILVAEGVPANHIKTTGLGYDQPVASGTTAGAHSRNRRVEILIRTLDPSVERTRTVTSLHEGSARPRARKEKARREQARRGARRRRPNFR